MKRERGGRRKRKRGEEGEREDVGRGTVSNELIITWKGSKNWGWTYFWFRFLAKRILSLSWEKWVSSWSYLWELKNRESKERFGEWKRNRVIERESKTVANTIKWAGEWKCFWLRLKRWRNDSRSGKKLLNRKWVRAKKWGQVWIKIRKKREGRSGKEGGRKEGNIHVQWWDGMEREWEKTEIREREGEWEREREMKREREASFDRGVRKKKNQQVVQLFLTRTPKRSLLTHSCCVVSTFNPVWIGKEAEDGE